MWFAVTDSYHNIDHFCEEGAMRTIIQIITLVWPLIREGVMGKYKVGAYLSRRKFTTFLLATIVFLMTVFIYMTEQANYHRNETRQLTTHLLQSKTEQERLRASHDKVLKKNKKYEAELVRIVIQYEVESPYVKSTIGVDVN